MERDRLTAWTPSNHSRPTAPPFFTADELADVAAFYGGAAATPLHHLTELARAHGLGDLLVKDETRRFGLSAFKILGVRYAMARLLETTPRLTDVACATAGNHGRAVARVARERGLFAHVYVPLGTPAAVVDALRRDGAHVAITSVGYDETVRLMADDAESSRWTIVSDTSWSGYETIPRWIMAGYTRLLSEAAAVWDTPPDLVIAQAGVGSFAGAVAGWLQTTFGRQRPRLLIVEPAGSACVMASLQAGRPVALSACAPTSMAGLRCGEISPLAWDAIAAVVDVALTIDDDAAAAAMRALAGPSGGDPAIDAGPSGAAGVAAAMKLASAASALETIGLTLTPATRVLAIVTEGSPADH